jgi:hypothetical protein
VDKQKHLQELADGVFFSVTIAHAAMFDPSSMVA